MSNKVHHYGDHTGPGQGSNTTRGHMKHGLSTDVVLTACTLLLAAVIGNTYMYVCISGIVIGSVTVHNCVPYRARICQLWIGLDYDPCTVIILPSVYYVVFLRLLKRNHRTIFNDRKT